MSEAYFTLEGRLQTIGADGGGVLDSQAALAAVMQATLFLYYFFAPVIQVLGTLSFKTGSVNIKWDRPPKLLL